MAKKKDLLIRKNETMFGSDGGKNPWAMKGFKAKAFLGKLDRKPTKFFRRKKK